MLLKLRIVRLPLQLFGSGTVKAELAKRELRKLNATYGTNVTTTTFTQSASKTPTPDASLAAGQPFRHIWHDLNPDSNVLFVLRHEFAHAALDADEPSADLFAAEWTAARGEHLVGLEALATNPGDLTHLPGPERLAMIVAAYWRVRWLGVGHFVARRRAQR